MANKKRRRRAAKRAAARAAAGSTPGKAEPREVERARDEPEAEPAGLGTGAQPAGPNRHELWIVLGLLLLLAINLVTSAVRNSGVCDELGAHIPAGHLYWASGAYSGGIDNFPLGQLWIAMPVKLLGLGYEPFTEQHLVLFRLPVMVLGLVLAVLVWAFTRRLFGGTAGVAALALATLSPNLIAHATLATLDLPTTCAVFASAFLLYRAVEAPSVRRVGLAAAAVAVAVAVKIQAILLLVVVAVAFGLVMVRAGRSGRFATAAIAASWLLIPLAIVLVVNLTYLRVPLIDGGLLPGPYLEALRTKLVHGGGGHFAYLLGRYSSSGWWYYFPVAILAKTPIPALVLLAIGLVRRHRLETAVFVLLPIVLFLGAGMASQLNIGLRHVLPIYPFLFVIAGAGAARLLRRDWRGLLLGVLGVAWIVQAVSIPPHHLSYFNLLAGGPGNGHRVLVDSNYDWGQNDHFLSRHVAGSGLEYQINPDPFRPTSGPILVNANALYGVLNGGPEAYRWLRDESPTDRIAYTWFEFDLDGDGSSRARPDWRRQDLLCGHLEWLRRNEPALADSKLRLTAARAYAEATVYGTAFELIRERLREQPADESALRLGGELIVRHKLGVLRYRDDEYLTGFRNPPSPARLPPDELVGLARQTGTAVILSTLYTQIGAKSFEERRLDAAIRASALAAALDPSNDVAVDNLRQMRAVKDRLSR